MYIFNNGRKSLNDQWFTSFHPKPDIFSLLLLSDDHGFLSPQTPRKPPSYVCRGTICKEDNVVIWFQQVLKGGHWRAKFVREAITAVANPLQVSHNTIRRLWQRALPILYCMLFSRYPTLCFASAVDTWFRVSGLLVHNSKHSSSLWWSNDWLFQSNCPFQCGSYDHSVQWATYVFIRYSLRTSIHHTGAYF
jgi:hypothetical protein